MWLHVKTWKRTRYTFRIVKRRHVIVFASCVLFLAWRSMPLFARDLARAFLWLLINSKWGDDGIVSHARANCVSPPIATLLESRRTHLIVRLEENLIVFWQSHQENNWGDVLKAMDPFSTLRSLAPDVDHPGMRQKWRGSLTMSQLFHKARANRHTHTTLVSYLGRLGLLNCAGLATFTWWISFDPLHFTAP